MRVIGAGFGRTGTTSLKAALEKLGFGPCYHMQTVFMHPWQARFWVDTADGKPVDWRKFFKGHQSTVDYPASLFYRPLMEEFPGAKILLSVRDPQRWYDSTLQTIYLSTKVPAWLNRWFPPLGMVFGMHQKVIWDGLFEGLFEDRDFAIEVFNRHTESVKAQVPAEKLLVFDVKEGWGPLCSFLDVPVPEEPFPHLNDRVQIQRLFRIINFFGKPGK
jgi:hypothetical protein